MNHHPGFNEGVRLGRKIAKMLDAEALRGPVNPDRIVAVYGAALGELSAHNIRVYGEEFALTLLKIEREALEAVLARMHREAAN